MDVPSSQVDDKKKKKSFTARAPRWPRPPFVTDGEVISEVIRDIPNVPVKAGVVTDGISEKASRKVCQRRRMFFTSYSFDWPISETCVHSTP